MVKPSREITTYKNQLAIKSLVQLFNEREIQLLVLLSFMLQIFLFFTGSLRRCTTNKFLRFLIWIAYLGADSVAVYALGILSRHEDTTLERDALMETHQLAFFWAPFFLIHLGGQDTVTAFAIEDNNLWLRHLLNLVIQVTLVLYIFWKSASGPNMHLLVPSILVFVTGTIKYGERTWALWRGRLKNLASSLVPFYAKQLEGPIHSGAGAVTSEVQRLADNSAALYSDVVSFALHSIQGVRDVFAETGFYDYSLDHESLGFKVDPELLPKILEIELGLMFDDIYTKAMVLRTRGGIVLRCISLISFLASSVLFFVSNKQGYNSADTAITYALFIGGFFLEVCAIFIATMSIWTFAWLKARNFNSLAFKIIGWQRKRLLWTNSMGQYNLLNYLGKYVQQSSLCKRRVMAVIRKVVNAVCKGNNKLLDTKFVEVDEEIMRRVVQRVLQCQSVGSSMGEQWPKLGPLLQKLLSSFGGRFEEVIGRLHIYTEVQLSRYPPTEEIKTSLLVRMCRKMSDYMLYLLATHPEMLPVKKGSEDYLPASLEVFMTAENLGNNSDRDDVILRRAFEKLSEWDLPEPPPHCTEEQLVEILDAWIRLLVYAAGKSRPEMHAAQLARGGELLTFTWLLMAHHLLGDVGDRIEIADIFDMEEARIPTRARRIRYDEATTI